MSLSPIRRDSEEVRMSIRTLTSLLHRFHVQKSPSTHSKDIPPLLRHFTTLLTRGERKDDQAKNVIAITCSIDASGHVSISVVTQNQSLPSSVKSISLKMIEKDECTLEEIVNRAPSVALAPHIADVWTALSAFNPSASDRDRQIESLELFFLSRSYRKFHARFKEGKKLGGDRWLHEVIGDWLPNRPEISRKWVVVPAWLLAFEGLPPIKSRKVGEAVQWEFSDDSKRAWAKVLGVILENLHDQIDEVRLANVKGKREEKAEAMRNLNVLCLALYYFVTWETGIVKSLLTETNLMDGITTPFMPMTTNNSTDETDDKDDGRLQEADEMDDEIDELLQEPNETKGQQVYRYLKTLVAWHAAVHSLSRDAAVPEVLRNLRIGLVEVPSSTLTVLPLSQVSEMLVTRFPGMKISRKDVLTTLETRYSDTFAGCVHAEATLMGLVNSYRQGAMVEIDQEIQDMIQPVADAGRAVIAASTKCCWCCDWLSQNLDMQFQVPGTHGLVFPWDPPTVGVDLPVLERLEESLWGEMHRVVSSEIQALLHSRHSSAASSEATATATMRFLRVNKVKRADNTVVVDRYKFATDHDPS